MKVLPELVGLASLQELELYECFGLSAEDKERAEAVGAGKQGREQGRGRGYVTSLQAAWGGLSVQALCI